MSNDYAQITIRTTKKEHKKIKSMAKKADITMNQFIVDTIFKENDIENDTNDTSENTNDTELIDVLKQQLESKDKQIENFDDRLATQLKNKDEQIKNLDSRLDAQQRLNFQSNQRIEKLELDHEEEIPTFSQDKKADDQGFFSRLFNL